MSSRVKKKIHYTTMSGHLACGLDLKKEYLANWKYTRFTRQVTCKKCKESEYYKGTKI